MHCHSALLPPPCAEAHQFKALKISIVLYVICYHNDIRTTKTGYSLCLSVYLQVFLIERMYATWVGILRFVAAQILFFFLVNQIHQR